MLILLYEKLHLVLSYLLRSFTQDWNGVPNLFGNVSIDNTFKHIKINTIEKNNHGLFVLIYIFKIFYGITSSIFGKESIYPIVPSASATPVMFSVGTEGQLSIQFT